MKFKITDNLPDLADQVTREEILILVPIAASLSSAFFTDDDVEHSALAKEVKHCEGRAIRKGKHSTAS